MCNRAMSGSHMQLSMYRIFNSAAVVLAADFLGEEVVQRHMNGAGRASLLRRIQAASKNDMELDHALKAYGAHQQGRRSYLQKHRLMACSVVRQYRHAFRRL